MILQFIDALDAENGIGFPEKTVEIDGILYAKWLPVRVPYDLAMAIQDKYPEETVLEQIEDEEDLTRVTFPDMTPLATEEAQPKRARHWR